MRTNELTVGPELGEPGSAWASQPGLPERDREQQIELDSGEEFDDGQLEPDEADDDDLSWAEPPPPTSQRLRKLLIALSIGIFGVSAFTVGAKVHESRASSSGPGFPAGFDPSALFGGAGFPGGGAGTGAVAAGQSPAQAGSSGATTETTEDPTLGGLFPGVEDDAAVSGAEQPADTEEITVSGVEGNEIVGSRADGSTVRVRISTGSTVAVPVGSSDSIDVDALTVHEVSTPGTPTTTAP